MKANAYLELYTRRAKKDGTFPLKIRVTYQRAYHDYKTDFDLTEEEYNEAVSARPKKEYKKLSEKLSQLRSKVNNIVNELTVFTYQKFEDAFYERVKDASDLYSLFQDYISNLESEGRIKTASSYTTAMNSFKEFRPRLSLYDIDPTFLIKYQEHRLGKKTSMTTIGIYVRSLRSVYNMAVSAGIIKKEGNYPFGKGKYIIPAGRNIKKALTLEEVSKIFHYKTIPGTPIDKAKDFWMFSYFCNGINFKDIAMLHISNIDGEMLRFVREKTKLTSQGNSKIISCWLTEHAKETIKKWGNLVGKKEDYLYDILSANDSPEEQMKKISQFIKNTNKYIKRICLAQGISKEATTYFARHSAATVLKRSGATIAQIQEALGHSTQSVTQSYLDSFDDDTKKNLANSLCNFVLKIDDKNT